MGNWVPRQKPKVNLGGQELPSCAATVTVPKANAFRQEARRPKLSSIPGKSGLGFDKSRK